MDLQKRRLLKAALFGAGGIGLRAFATGLPLGFFTGARAAKADGTSDSDASAASACVKPQYLILSTSHWGDPLNCNVPGAYADGTYHSADPSMAATPMSFGGKTYQGAKAWSQMMPEVLSRTSFLHHATYTNSHGDGAKVNRLQGAVQRQEMLVSLLAKSTGPCLGAGGDAGMGGTVQPGPVVLCNELITYSGAVMPSLNPLNLQQVLTGPNSPLLQNIQALRDRDLDSLNKLVRQSGNQAQRTLLDTYAQSQTELRNVNQQILSDLARITGTTRTDYNIAASVLVRLNVSPVVVMSYSFGGDNHTDVGLENEASNTVASIAAIGDLYSRLKSSGHGDDTTLLFQNVFGRSNSIASHGGEPDGRSHCATHHCTVLVGSGVRSGVIGGITLNASNTDFRATAFDSATGASDDAAGDVPYEDTLASVGKTVGIAVGVPQTILDTQITQGKVIPAALVG